MSTDTATDGACDARILVVDDEPANVELVVRSLRAEGYHDLWTAADGVEAVARWSELSPDLVILDLLMPRMNGHEVLRQIRAAQPEDEFLPFIVCTADSTDDARRKALNAGATDVMVKPLDLFSLLLQVRNLLQARSLYLAVHERKAVIEAELQSQWRERLQERSDLVRRLVEAQEVERRRIARELHDETMQSLIATALRLEHLGRTSEAAEELGQIAAGCREMVDGLRALVADLRSPTLDDRDLHGALAELVAPHDGVAVELDVPTDLDLPADLAVELYRIAQAAVTNVFQHAHATRLRLGVVRHDGRVRLTIEDDGVGFDSSTLARRQRAGHLGLTITKERVALLGGRFQVTSDPGKGCTIVVDVPLEPPEPSVVGDHDTDLTAEPALGRPRARTAPR